MFRRTYIGLDIRVEGICAMAIQRRGQHLALVGGHLEPFFNDVLQPGFKELNILDPDSLIESLKKVVTSLNRKENRVAVALPDASGQIYLLDLDTPFKNRSEGAEIVRWRLKDNLPDKTGNYAVDFQILDENEAGTTKVLAAVISRDILHQYERVLDQAGFQTAVIDFHSLALYNAYRSKIDLGDDFILIGIDSGQLCVLVFVNRCLFSCRCRAIDKDIRTIFQEINRSLVSCRRDIHGFQRLPVYMHSDWDEQGPLFDAVDSAFEQRVQVLISPVSKLLNGYPVNFTPDQSSGMVAALGASERLIKGVA